jgi:hypothetical protein
LTNGAIVGEPMPKKLDDEVMHFIEINFDVLTDHWEYRILADELQRRLRPIQ